MTSRTVLAATASFEKAALATGQIRQPITIIPNPTLTAAIIQVPLAERVRTRRRSLP